MIKKESDEYREPRNVIITLKDNQVFEGKYNSAIGFITSDGRMIWKENVLFYKTIKE